MKYLALLFVGLAAAVLLSLIWVRVATVDPSSVHVAPRDAERPKTSGIRLRGDRAPVFDATPRAVMETLEKIALSKNRVTLIASTKDPLRMTFETRTKWLRFPDHLTFEAHPVDGGTRLEVLARSRFALYDWGINATRVERWTSALREALRQ